MKINNGALVKKMRKELGLSQENLAEQLFISVRQLSRIESGEASMDIWQFITTLELLGHPTDDFWLLYLDSHEYDSYRIYKRLKRQMKSSSQSEIKDLIASMETSPLINQPFIKQLMTLIKISIEEMPPKEELEKLQKAMEMSKPNFDIVLVSTYRMTYNEIYIALGMAQSLAILGKHDKAISMIESIIQARENIQASEDDAAALFPSLHFILSHILISAERYKEALKASTIALETCREYNNLKNVPEILLAMATCYYKLEEEEHIYKTHLIRAYHAAYAIGKNDVATHIKNEASNTFGISLPVGVF